MKETEGAEGTKGIRLIQVSNQAYSFLFITYRDIESQKEGTKKKKDTDNNGINSHFYLEKSKKVSKLIKKAILEWEEENKELLEVCKEKLKFLWTDTKSPAEKKNGFLESELIGKHDFFHLLQCPWVPELGNLVEKISQNLKDEVHTKELVGVPCAAVDFKVNETYFIGNVTGGPWFKREDFDPILLDSGRIHALMFVDLKKGLGIKDRRLSLPDFLSIFVSSDDISKCLKRETRESIKGFFLGYGIYELIFLLESDNLTDLFISVADIRRCFYKNSKESGEKILARGTSTMVFMPREITAKREKKSGSPDPKKKGINYSVIVATKTGKDIDVARRITEDKNILKDRKEEEINIFDRQGYYDLIVSFKEPNFCRACEIVTCIRNYPDVLGTSTIIKIDEKKIMEKFDGDDADGG